jgi:hypothetical protein
MPALGCDHAADLVAEPDAKNTLSVSSWMTRPSRRISVRTFASTPCSRASLSIRRLSASKDFCSCAAALAEESLSVCRSLSAVVGWMAGIGGCGAAFSALSPWPDAITALPPESTAPENASCSDRCSASNLDVFTDEIANRTMNRQNSSVIMSA